MSAMLRYAAAFLLLLVAVTALAAPKPIRIVFKEGASEASVSGRLKGHAGVDYLFAATTGETIAVTLKSETAGLGFVLLAPMGNQLTFQATEYRGVAPADGDYKVTVQPPPHAESAPPAPAAFTLTVGHEARTVEEPVEQGQ